MMNDTKIYGTGCIKFSNEDRDRIQMLTMNIRATPDIIQKFCAVDGVEYAHIENANKYKICWWYKPLFHFPHSSYNICIRSQ